MKTRISIGLDVSRKLTEAERIEIRQDLADYANMKLDLGRLLKDATGYFFGPEEEYP
jgi:hypothetical protein